MTYSSINSLARRQIAISRPAQLQRQSKSVGSYTSLLVTTIIVGLAFVFYIIKASELHKASYNKNAIEVKNSELKLQLSELELTNAKLQNPTNIEQGSTGVSLEKANNVTKLQ